jgi:hypothetical protein
MRLDPGGAFGDSILTGFGCFSPSDKAFDWIADRLEEGPTGIVALGIDYSAVVSSLLCETRTRVPYIAITTLDS